MASFGKGLTCRKPWPPPPRHRSSLDHATHPPASSETSPTRSSRHYTLKRDRMHLRGPKAGLWGQHCTHRCGASARSGTCGPPTSGAGDTSTPLRRPDRGGSLSKHTRNPPPNHVYKQQAWNLSHTLKLAPLDVMLRDLPLPQLPLHPLPPSPPAPATAAPAPPAREVRTCHCSV
jgi:hypothetical protein